jgi:glycosyltransferase involved in cell wall biosynthesis
MEYRPYYLAREWTKQKNMVTIIAATQSHIRTNNPEYDQKITEEYRDVIKYIWIRTRKYTGNGIDRILNMLDYIKGVYSILPQLIKENPDVVVASSTYPLDNYPAYKLAKKTGAKYVYEVHDIWPLSPMELGGYSKYHPFILLMQWAENFAYKHVDKVVSILPCAKQHMVEHGLLEDKFIHIPNGISLEEMDNPEPVDKKVMALIPKDKFIVGYTGTFGLSNSLKTLFEASSIIQKQNNKIFFVIIGKGLEKNKLVELKNELDLKNLIIIDAIPKKQIQSVLQLFDICAITWNKNPLYKLGVSANKYFDYMYASKPIIQAVESGNDLVKDAECGFTVESENPKAVAGGIIKLFNMSKEERETIGENGHRYVIENHNYRKLAKDFLDIFSE